MQTKIYLACVRPLQEKEAFERFYAEASPKRKEKICRYRYQKDRLLSLGADMLLRNALQEAGLMKPAPQGCEEPGVNPQTGREQWPVIAYGEQGKPYIAGAEGFHYNLSHDGEYVLLVVSDAEVGCDIEQIRPVDLKLPRHAFHPAEYERIAACAEAERNELFFRYWVLKESYIKALGTGLSEGLSSFCMEFGDGIRATVDGVPQPFGFAEGGDLPGYRYAVCRKGGLEEVTWETVGFRDFAWAK